MAIRSSGAYNSPEIAQVASNIAQMFAPPSASDMAGYSAAALNRQKHEQIAQLFGSSANPSEQSALVGIQSFGQTPLGFREKFTADNAAQMYGYDKAAQAQIYGKMVEPIAPGYVRPGITEPMADMFGGVPIDTAQGLPKPMSETEVKGQALAGLPEDQLISIIRSEPPVETILGENGLPTIVARSDAIGQQPAPKDPLVSVGAGESSYDREVGSGMGKQYLTMQDAATTARSSLNSLAAMEQALSEDGFYSGFGGEQVLALKRLTSALGGDAGGVTSMETFNAAASQAALDNMGGSLGAGFSNADREFVLGMVPNLGTTREGNLALIEIHKRIAQRKLEVAALADQYASENGGRIDAGFNQYLTEWAGSNPLFPQTAGAAPATPAGPVAPPTGAINALRADPSRAAEFDAKYGEGAAAAVLGVAQ